MPDPIVSPSLLLQLSQNAPLYDEQGTFPAASFNAIAEAGLLEAVLPGKPMDYEKKNTPLLLNLLKLVGSADLSVGRILEGHYNALYLVHLYAGTTRKQAWYHDVLQYRRLFGVWNTQAENGIRLCKKADNNYVIEGCKTFCSGSHYIDSPVITGELTGDKNGWQMCIVPMEKVKKMVPDKSFWQPMGMKGSVSHRLDFTGIEISENDLLGAPQDYYAQPAFSGGAIRFAAVQLGGAEAIFNETSNYLRKLGRIQDPFQRARIAEMAVLIASGNHWLQTAATKADAWLACNEDPLKIVAYANMTRTAIEEICLRTMQLAEKCVGARGLMRPGALERIHRDLTFYLRQPAPDASLMAIGEYVLNQTNRANELWS